MDSTGTFGYSSLHFLILTVLIEIYLVLRYKFQKFESKAENQLGLGISLLCSLLLILLLFSNNEADLNRKKKKKSECGFDVFMYTKQEYF